MEVSGDKKSTQMSLDIIPLFVKIVSNLVQALVITYDEIFQALAVEGDDVLLQKQFLDLGFDDVVRWKSPASEMFSQLARHVEVQESRVETVRCLGWGSIKN
jgi:hypothetical protein